jgi:nitric oxide reductase NorD protein
LIDRTLEGFPPDVISELEALLPQIPSAMHERLLELTEELVVLSCPAAVEFLKSYSFVTERAGPTALEYWFREGIELLQKSEQGGIEYFRIGTSKSARLLEKLSPGVELAVTKDVIETYCLALAGRKTPILPLESLIAGQSASAALLTHGSAVFLPEFVDRYSSKPQNFGWYKVMATHQIGHIEFGSYELRIDDDIVTLYHNLGLQLKQELSDGTETDLVRFLKLFPDSKLAIDIFTIVEDSRVDFLIKHWYRGIRQDFGDIQAEALSIRPPITSHSPREALLEILVRLSLEHSGKWLAPAILRTPLYLAANTMSGILSPETSVQDSARIMMLLYYLTSRVPGNRSRIDSWEAMEIDGHHDKSSTLSINDIDRVLKDLSWNVVDTSVHFSPAKVEYRGIFGLEPARKIGEVGPIDEDRTEVDYPSTTQKIIRKRPIEKVGMDEEQEVGALAADRENLEETPVFGMGRVSEPETTPSRGQSEKESDDDIEGALEADGTLSYLYDEWDFRASDYRLRWCRVHEIPLAEGTPEFYEATLDEYAQLLAQIRGRFEQLNPRSPRKVKRLHDGEDIDLDLLIDFVIGRKAGQSSEAKIYWRRNKTERDVSVVFLLDMSSSTVEYINRIQRDSINPVFARDFRDYFEWLHSDHKGQALRPKEFKRIIDLEKESTVLLIRALEVIGDNYGIYGFSGHGRENVEFYVVKDIEEDFSDQVKGRIDSIIPQQGTRMGPAIRHATWKLERQESRGKFLFLISDGRPEDHSYGREGLETDYAINDTKMALLEARRKGITSLCLTFDRVGHDYLRTVCGDMPYEVLADIESLPASLPTLYGWVTT